MRVAVDILAISAGRTKSGLYQYVDHLTRCLPAADPGGRVTLYCGRADLGWATAGFPGRRVRAVRPPPRFYRVWRDLAEFNRADVYLHELCSDIGPITRGANVYCVPDVIPLALPVVFGRHLPAFAEYYAEAVRHADAIICWTRHTKADIVARAGGDPGRIHVVPLAAGAEYVPLPPAAVAAGVAGVGLTPGGYVLSVATVEVRKNYPALVRAFAEVVRRDPGLPHKLVIAGKPGDAAGAVADEVRRAGLGDRVVLLGFAPDLPALYNGAAAFVFPSRYEGFGLPPLEAMACGTPVVCSDATSLPEVVGDAALVFTPDDVGLLADHLHRLLTDPAARADYRERGLRRAAGFSWDRTAAGYMTVFRAAHARRVGRPEAVRP